MATVNLYWTKGTTAGYPVFYCPGGFGLRCHLVFWNVCRENVWCSRCDRLPPREDRF